MDLIKVISRLFNEQAEEVNRILIITKSSNKEEIEKYEKELRENDTRKTEPGNKTET